MAQILVADDNHDVAHLIRDYLVAKGHIVVTAYDGFQLAQKASEHLPHLIITDIQMPGSYGNTVYDVLQKDPRTSSIPVLFISGHPLEKIGHLIPKDPKTRFIKKPINFQELEEALKELLPLGGYRP